MSWFQKNTNYPATMPPELEQTLGDRLAKSLKFAGLNYDDMAEALSLHRNSIGAYCTGRTVPIPLVLKAWASIVELPEEWLLTGVYPETHTAAANRQTYTPATKKAPAQKATRGNSR